MSSERIDILLATHNGEAFLEEQVESLAAQTYSNLRILVFDDGSTDRTPQRLERLAGRYANLELIGRNRQSAGPVSVYSRLLSHAGSAYIMFCDQDDIWLPHKVEISYQTMRQAEARTPDTPLLVHTDLQVVGADLTPLAPSFWKYQHLSPAVMTSLPRLLVQNTVTGCTVMINRALAEHCGHIPPAAIMHDWWLALLAAAFGRIETIPEATVLYRQHPANSVGAKKWGLAYVLSRGIRFLDRDGMIKSLKRTEQQASAFLEHHGERLLPDQRELVAAYARISSLPWLARRRVVLRHGLFKYGFLRNLGLLLRI